MQALPAAMGRPQRQPSVAQASCAERSSLLPKAIRTTCAFARMTMRFSPCGYLTTILGSPALADHVVQRPVSGKPRALPPRSDVARISIHYGYGAKRARRGPSRTQIGLRRRSSRSLLPGRNSAGKEFGEARDWAGVFGDTRRFRVTETAPSRIPRGKAAESQRLFRRRRETAMAQDCVVGPAGAACTHRINDISAQTSPKSQIGAKRQLSGVTNFATTNAAEELGAIAPSALQTDVLRAIPAKAGTNAVAGAGSTAPSPPQTATLRAMLVRATKRRRRPA
jgi:hypothetical protein